MPATLKTPRLRNLWTFFRVCLHELRRLPKPSKRCSLKNQKLFMETIKLSQLRMAAWNACGIGDKRAELKQFMSEQNAAWNACGIGDKRAELKQFMSEQNINIMLIGETWLRPGDTLTVPNFYTYRGDRLTGRNGGVAILIKKE
ncbi:hypothetical protein QE152_g38051 [Popillia japonica]|uniref:Uncharacterized protein n=1 Tax=Popillia japonica TaxID=7064 RepID=A0AAW1I915_POPJA